MGNRYMFVPRQAWIRAFRPKGGNASEKIAGLRIGFVAATAGLIMMFWAINQESTVGTARYYQANTYDLVATQHGSTSQGESSSVPPQLMRELEATPGVRADGMMYYWGRIQGRDVLYGMYRPGGSNAPPLAKGRDIASDQEATIDDSLADILGIHIGDSFDLVDQRFTIVGTTLETGSYGKELLFISPQAMFNLYGGAEVYNTIAIKFAPGTTKLPDDLVARWAGKVDFITRQAYIDGNIGYWASSITPLIAIIIAVLTALALPTLLVILIKQISLQLPTLGIMRAVGASRRQIGAIEALTMAYLGVAGFVLGIPLGYLLIQLTNLVTPGFHATLGADGVLMSAAAVLMVCLIAVAVGWYKAGKATPMALIRA